MTTRLIPPIKYPVGPQTHLSDYFEHIVSRKFNLKSCVAKISLVTIVPFFATMAVCILRDRISPQEKGPISAQVMCICGPNLLLPADYIGYDSKIGIQQIVASKL